MSVPWGVCRVHAFWNPIGLQPEDTQLVCEDECSVPIHLQGALKMSEQVQIALSLSVPIHLQGALKMSEQVLLALSLSLFLTRSLTHSLSVSPSVSICPLSLCLSLFFSLILSFSNFFLIPSLSLSLLFSLSVSLSLSLYLSPACSLPLTPALSQDATISDTEEAADVKEDADQEAIAARARVKTRFGKGTRGRAKKRTAVKTTKATKLRTPNKRTAAKATELLPTDKVLQDPIISVAAGRRQGVRLRAQQFHQGRMVWVFVYSLSSIAARSSAARAADLVHAIIEMGQIQDKIETEKLCKDDVLKLITPRRHTRRC